MEKQRLEASQERHKERRAFFTAQVFERGRQIRRERERQALSAVAPDSRARSVGYESG